MNPPRPPLSRLPAGLLALCLGLATASAQTAPVQSAAQAAPTRTTAANGGDYTLQMALDRLAQAPSVTQARLSVQVAQTSLQATRTALGLSVSVTGNAGYSGGYDTTGSSGQATTVPSSTSGSAGVSVSLGVLPWSTNQLALRKAEGNLVLAQAQLNTAQNAARLNVAQQYYGGVLATRDLTVAQANLAVQQRALQVAQTRQASGNATAETVLAAQAAVQSAQAAVVTATASLSQARLSLGAALGTPLGEIAFVGAPPDTVTLPDVEALVAQARTSRSEVANATLDLTTAQDALAQERRDVTLPTVTAGLTYGPSSGSGLSTSLNLQQGTLGASYTVPFNSNSVPNHLIASVSGSYTVYSPAARAQLAAAEATVTQSQLSLDVARQTVELDVRTRYNTAQTSLIAIQTQLAQVQVAQAALAAGTGTQDNVAAAQLALEQAQRTLLSARITAQLNRIQLLNASGGAQ